MNLSLIFVTFIASNGLKVNAYYLRLIGRLFFLIDIGLRFSYAEIKSHGSAKGR